MTVRRPISQKQRAKIVERQNWLCAICELPIARGSRFEVDHIHALVHDGSNDDDNLRAAHPKCHRLKSNADVRDAAHVKRIRYGKSRKGAPMHGSRASGWKRNFDGTVERR